MWLPSGLSEAYFCVIVGASFISSFLTSALGVGGGALLLAIMASFVPPAALIPVHGVVQLGSNLGRMLMLAKSVHLSVLPLFAVGSIAGCLIGGMVSIDLPPYAVQMAVGAFIIWTIVSRPPKWMARWPALSGVVSSVLTMFFGATGPFVASYARGFNLSRQSYVGTNAALMTIQHGIKIIVFGLLGFAFAPWMLVLVTMILGGLLGTFCGQLALGRMSDRLFVRALNVTLIVVSLRLIAEGFSELAAASR